MGSAIPVIDGAQRKFISMNPVVIAGGKELAEFIRIKQANTGLTGSELVPTYTNLSEGLGLFTSKSTASRGELTLTPPTRDSLRNGQFTKTLNFQ